MTSSSSDFVIAFSLTDVDSVTVLILSIVIALSTAIVVFLSKLGPAVAAYKREVGFADAEVRARIARVEEAASQVVSIKADLAAERSRSERLRLEVRDLHEHDRVRRHEMANDLGGQIAGLKADLMEARRRIATLKARLGVTDSSHALAINTVADSVELIVNHLDPPIGVPVLTTHVEPADVNAESDVDLLHDSPEEPRP